MRRGSVFFIVTFEHNFIHFSIVFIADFEQVNVSWVKLRLTTDSVMFAYFS